MYQLRVLVNGRPVPIYRDYRTGLNWIEARNGTKYEIEVRNDSYNRILAVASVDGLNVIDGKHEDPMTAPGYILHQHNNIKIPGWKISADNVREFYFTPQDQSYSAKLGANPSNTGVIAAAIYKEKYYYTYTYGNYTPPIYNPEPWPQPYTPWINTTTTIYGSSTSDSSKGQGVLRSFAASSGSSGEIKTSIVFSAQANYLSDEIPVEPKLATGSGAVTDFRTHKATFGERVLETVLTLYYDTREGLEKRGIFSQSNSLPRPFPNTEFCPDV